MKKATGELNLTVIVLIAVGAILGFFMIFKDTMFKSVMSPMCCIMSKGSMKDGTCNTKNQADYHSCLGGGSESVNKGNTNSENIQDKGFLDSSNSINNSSISNNTKDLGVEKSINSDLSVPSNIDTTKDDKTNQKLNTDSKNTIKEMTSNTKGSKEKDDKENTTSGKITGANEEEIKNKTSEGIKTKGDYTKSTISNTTSNYSSDKSTYTTTSTVKSNTSNYQMTVTSTYKKDKEGNYTLTEISWKETTASKSLSDGYQKEITVGEKKIKNSYNGVLKEQYSTEKMNKYIEENAEAIYNELNGKVVFLTTYRGESVVLNTNGVFITPGVIVTTWNYLKNSVINGDKIVITNADGGNYTMDGIISINTELDLAFIKLKEKLGETTDFGNVYDLKVESIDFTVCTGEDYTLEVKYGYLLKRGGLITSLITLEKNEEGSPLFDYNKQLIGINTSNVLKSSTSIARSTNYIKNLQQKLQKKEFSTIQVTSFNDLKEKYINDNSEIEDNTIPKEVWKKYKKIGDIENTISLNLIKSSYDENIVSLRYVNDIEKYSNSFSLANDFIIKLEKQGYKLKHYSTYKKIYQKGSSKVILLSEFNYLIIIMMGE